LTTSTTPSTLTLNCFDISTCSMMISSPHTLVQILLSSMDSQVCRNSLNMSFDGTIQWITNRLPNELSLPVLALMIPFGSTTTFYGLLFIQLMFVSGVPW
jgi:hypothetical protein